MTAARPNSAHFAFLALGVLWFAIASAAPPPRIEVTGAEPNSALQGEALEVVISGSGFGHGDTVRYLVTGTNDESQIDVLSVTYNEADDTLTTTIQVAEAALVSDYDIEVQPLSGRRGKGTTLFSVQFNSNGGGQSNPDTTTCDALFGFAPGTCTAEGTMDDCVLLQDFNEGRTWKMTQNCDTRAMLVVDSTDPMFFGAGFRLNLVAPWSGDYAGITNSRGASRIDNVHIVVDDPNVAAGCGAAGKVQAAISFDPDREPRSGAPRGSVGRITVETRGGARFCNGIEYVGSNPYIGNPYKSVHVASSYIMANSYEAFGIWMANVNMSDLNDQVKNEFAFISHNIVEASDSPCAVPMLVGPDVERPVINDNLVYAPDGSGCAAARTVGIAVLDSGRNMDSLLGPAYDFLTASPSDTSSNVVETGGNGSIGILVIGGTDAESTKNLITAGDAADYAVCVETGANFDEIKKASDYIGFDAGNQVVFTNDCGAVLP